MSTVPPAMEPEEFAGSSVDAAVQAGLERLGLDGQDVEVEVLDRGSKGFLGLGARTARVQIAPKVTPSPEMQALVEDLLSRMEISGDVVATRVGRTAFVEIESEADGLLIGRRGETLEALQHVLTRMAGRRHPGLLAGVRVDVAGYRKRREDQLVAQARTLAERVQRNGRRMMTEPLPPAERRVVHRALEAETGIRTHVGGSGVNRRIIITPDRAKRRKPRAKR